MSLPEDLVAFVDEEARRSRTTRSRTLARLLRGAQVRLQTRAYLDRHGWDVVEDEEKWRAYQKSRMAEEYAEDHW